MPGRKPVADGLFTEGPEGVRLMGGRDRETGRHVFPMPAGPGAKRFEAVPLSPTGALWSFTVQRFPPKPPYRGETDPAKFQPYAVGYVELPGQVIVETRVKTDNFAALKIGMPMRITTETFATDKDGDAIVTYAFEPA